MKLRLTLAIVVLLVSSAALAGGNGNSVEFIRLIPDKSNLDQDIPVLGLTGECLEFDGYRGRILMIGWIGGDNRIHPTEATGKRYLELKFIIFPKAGLRPRQVTRYGEPGMDFECKERIPGQEYLISLRLCADRKQFWERDLRLIFGKLKVYPKGPYDPTPYYRPLS